MRVKIFENEDKENYGDGASYEVMVDDKTIVYVSHSMQPEDARLGRDLHFVYSIPEALKKAYEAGKRGEVFEVEIVKESNN